MIILLISITCPAGLYLFETVLSLISFGCCSFGFGSLIQFGTDMHDSVALLSSLMLTLATFCSLSSHYLLCLSVCLFLSLSACGLSALCTDLSPVYSSGINRGSQRKLASVDYLLMLNMALDHSGINLPLTNRANDAHPTRCPLEEIVIHLFLSFWLFSS